MGDRSNIVVVDHKGDRVWLYGHWMGADSINVVRDVLGRHARWDDPAYLARMLFEKMIEGAYDKETGFGISTFMCDNEYPVIVLDTRDQTVTLEDSAHWGHPLDAITPPVSFEQFIYCGNENPTFADVAVDMGAKLTPQ